MPISMNLWKIALVKMTCNLIKKKYQVELIKYNYIYVKFGSWWHKSTGCVETGKG